MGRVREKMWWRKEEKWREREEEKETSPPSLMKVLPLKFRKKILNTRQRLKTKIELAIKFSPLDFVGSATGSIYVPTAKCRAVHLDASYFITSDDLTYMHMHSCMHAWRQSFEFSMYVGSYVHAHALMHACLRSYPS
jgi:hypothetical protein